MNHTAPLSMTNSRDHYDLTLKWSETEIQILSHQQLRGACPCAKCRAARIRGYISLVNDDVKLLAINSMGYGVQMVFSDGHDRGIYPWGYLWDLS